MSKASGYFKVSREALESDLYNSKPFDIWHAWEYLFGWARFRSGETFYLGNAIPLGRGQLATSARQLAKAFGWSVGKVRRFLDMLRARSMVDLKTEHRVLIVTICNYETYQGDDSQTEHRRARDGTQTDSKKNTIEESKEGKQVRRVIKEKSGPDQFPVPIELADLPLYAADRTMCKRYYELVALWATAYPGVSVSGEIRKAHAWEVSNPSKRKVNRPKFLNTWLSREQDKYRPTELSGTKHDRPADFKKLY